MKRGSAALLADLERAARRYGSGSAATKRALLGVFARRRLATAAQVRRLHEVLCFLRAFPDDAMLLRRVDHLLAGFGRRSDLRRHRRALADSGIAGTATHYRFFWFTALWLVRRWPQAVAIDWPEFTNQAEFEPLLPLLLPAAEAEALEADSGPLRRRLARLARPGETDGAFLVRRFAALASDGFVRERLYERLDPPLRLDAAPGTPSRTRARAAGFPVVYRTRPLDRARPDLRRAARRPPLVVRAVPRARARRLLDLARDSMVTRSRDLDSFEHADPADVRLVDLGDGLQLVAFGLVPERRALLDSIYGYLTLQSGVPIGYVLTSALFRSALVAYNVFETFRGAEAAQQYGRVLATVRALFAADTFAVDPYQLGHDNAEGQRSGAWWFYYKLGFRPVDPGVRRLLRAELARLRTDPAARSSRSTLQRLSAAHLFLHLGRPRADVLGRVDPARVSAGVSGLLAQRFGGEREAGLRACAGEAARLLGGGPNRSWSAGERLAWERWAPLVLALPGVRRWSADQRRALVAVVRAKGGRRESDFVALFDRHRRLRQAVLRLAQGTPATGS